MATQYTLEPEEKQRKLREFRKNLDASTLWHSFDRTKGPVRDGKIDLTDHTIFKNLKIVMPGCWLMSYI